ncbi:putative Tetratricopeptide repeat-like superfamily protein [Hibiscus syriacus]|uniref:Tetratricopeptide repeat-like superfamily protein n=1 Tax=Hibiscus syriacus TaxID=106335 RepID=A0A6A2YD07_HIBSY|nr:putative Tetratricopeptide repeat-like superfamily protein [Hibiscus syriacus]
MRPKIAFNVQNIACNRGIFWRERNAKNPRVSEVRSGEAAKLLEDVVKDANCAVEETVEDAVKASGMAVSKAVVANKAVELENSKLEECDDAELAFRFHRAMNSSPRISKNRNLSSDNSLYTLTAGSSRALSCLKQTKMVYARHRKKPAEIELRDIVYARHRKKPAQIVDARHRKVACEKLNAQHRNKQNEMVYVRRGKKPYKFVSKRRRNHNDNKEKSGVEMGLKERGYML